MDSSITYLPQQLRLIVHQQINNVTNTVFGNNNNNEPALVAIYDGVFDLVTLQMTYDTNGFRIQFIQFYNGSIICIFISFFKLLFISNS